MAIIIDFWLSKGSKLSISDYPRGQIHGFSELGGVHIELLPELGEVHIELMSDLVGINLKVLYLRWMTIVRR